MKDVNDNALDPIPSDGIIMLTWSNWFTELRSNRYHYASRFAKMFPVLFVQPDLESESYSLEETEIPNVTVVHVSNKYNDTQIELLNAALLEMKVIKPVFWVYNINFEKFLRQRYSVLNIYHGTEDYLASESHLKFRDSNLVKVFNRMLDQCHLLVSVSEGVADSFQRNSRFQGKMVTVTNGCDFKFYNPEQNVIQPIVEEKKDIVFYQGNIFDKLDYELLIELAKRLPSWQFNFCGKIVFNEPLWQTLCELPNVVYLGLLSPESIRDEAYKSTVGIIPFVENEWLIDRSFPLKAFEYLACGLPVVSVPIKALLKYDSAITFVSGVDQFESAIRQSKSLRMDAQHTEKRLALAAAQDYDLKFQQVIVEISELSRKSIDCIKGSRLKVGVLYNPAPAYNRDSCIYLTKLMTYSTHDIGFIPMIKDAFHFTSLFAFDVIILYVSNDSADKACENIPSCYVEKIKGFGGYKILFANELAIDGKINTLIKNLGIHAVHTNNTSLIEQFADFFALQNVPLSVKLMTMPDANFKVRELEKQDLIIDFDRFLMSEIIKEKQTTGDDLIYALVAIKKDGSYNVNFEPDDFLAYPSKSVFLAEDFDAQKNITPRHIKKLVAETKSNLQMKTIVTLRAWYLKMPCKEVIKKITPSYFRKKLTLPAD